MKYSAMLSPAYLTVLLVLVLAAIGMDSAVRGLNLHLTKAPIYAPGGRTLGSLPIETEHWIRAGISDSNISAEVQKTLGTDNFISRRYRRKDQPAGEEPVVIELHAAYYTGQIDTVPHVPERCFVGGGWSRSAGSRVIEMPLDHGGWLLDEAVPEAERGRIYTVRLPNDHPDHPGVRVRLPRDADQLKIRVMRFVEPSGATIHSGYFFIANGGWTPTAEDVRLLSYRETDTYAYYMKVQFTSTQVGSEDELASAAASLLDDLLGDLMLCVPDWVEVEQGRYPPAETDQSQKDASDRERPGGP